MVIKLDYERSNEIGVFMKLTNSFCIIPYNAPKKFFNILSTELGNRYPIVKTYICNTRCIGSLVIGNSKGLLLPNQTSNSEMMNLREFLPSHITIKKIKNNIMALGNCVALNDYTALVNPELDSETQELLSDTLGVEVFKVSIGSHNNIGSYCVFNNKGGVVFPNITNEDQEEISSLLNIPLLTSTVNCGSVLISSGAVCNDFSSFTGFNSTHSETYVLESAFKISQVSR
jgi:translation initiation factor 6